MQPIRKEGTMAHQWLIILNKWTGYQPEQSLLILRRDPSRARTIYLYLRDEKIAIDYSGF